MRTQALRAGFIAVIAISALGCKKKKPPATMDEPSPAPANTVHSGEIDATNRADILRYSDEVPLHGAVATMPQTALARTAPGETWPIVENLSTGTPVLRFAERSGYTLVTFDSPSGRRGGWIPSAALVPSAAPPPQPTVTVSPKPNSGRCKLELRVSGFTPSNPRCQFNEKVRAGSPANIEFACAGRPVTARFQNQAFTGTASSSRVSLSHTENYKFNNCTYKSVQSISGAPPNLSYTYSESLVSGSCKETSTCTAKATVTASAP